MDSYDETAFKMRVESALVRVRMILEATRNPQRPSDVPHAYDDKFLLAEFLTRVTGASLVQCLGNIGLAPEGLAQLAEWAKTRSVTLRLRAKEDCTYLREETRKVESATEVVTESRGLLGKSQKSTKLVTTITEHFWRFDLDWELFAFQGTNEDARVELVSRKARIEIKTAAKTTPRPQAVVRSPIDLDLSWLLRRIDGESRVAFAIDRTDAACHTPRRNPEVDAALSALDGWHAWCGSVHSYFVSTVFPAQQEHGLDLAAIHERDIFVPVIPLFENRADGVLPIEYADAFLEEQQRSLAEKCRDLTRVFPRNDSVITAVEASLLVILLHARQVCQAYANGVAHIEQMLRNQLIAAIGKELTPVHFAEYMDFHSRKLLRPEYRPRPFSHAVRRPEHYPEGVLSLEADRGGSMPDPISTSVAVSEAVRPMSFALDAATRVSFLGERYLHAWISHQFSGSSGLALSLVARARQFSSFILLVGRIASADAFEPKFGIIVQNKDLLRIPLMLEPIPTPKQFRDAIESLSPEQQRFAKAFRAMQLESTLFGVCVIQIKPQLEVLLKLPPDALTKEIKLTQELLSLFIEYQIPSDLLSYDGPDEAQGDEKLARVKEYVGRMQEMIAHSRQKEIDEAREREALRLAEMNRTAQLMAPPQPAPMPFGPPMGGPPPMSGAMPMGMAAPPGMPPPSAPRMMAPSPGPMPPPASPPQAAPPPPQPKGEAPPPRSEPKRADPQRAAPASAPTGDTTDYTQIPAELDEKFEALDEDGALRPSIIHPGDTWTRSSQKGLLAAAATATLRANEQKDEKNRAFDLLDALSKSGALPIEHASLHVVLAATHCFDKTLVDTVIQNNVNPIEKVERSLMIVATTIHQRPAIDLLADDQRERFLTYSPRLGPGE
jgi:hypothetical protein